MGLHTNMADGGTTLSGGQLQRLLIARAVIRRPRVLIMDEATSALDNVTQRQVVTNRRALKCTQGLRPPFFDYCRCGHDLCHRAGPGGRTWNLSPAYAKRAAILEVGRAANAPTIELVSFAAETCRSMPCSLLLHVRVRRLWLRITSKGQVTIPAKIRERAGLLPQTEVEFEFDGKVVRIRRAKARKGDGRGARLVAHLRGRGDVTMSTDAIMALTRDD